MPNLILRPRLISSDGKPIRKFALQLRYHESLGETEYYNIAHVNLAVAREIIRAGAPCWLFGEPKDTETE